MIDMQAVLDDAKEVKPLGTLNGKKVLDFQDNNAIAKAEKADEKLNGKKPELGTRELRADGAGYKRTMTTHAAVDPEIMFANRYRVAGTGDKKKYEVVKDYRAITEQASGNIYTHILTAYVVGGKTPNLVIEGIKTITADEFVAEFTDDLDEKSMIMVDAAIAKYRAKHGNVKKTGDKINL